MVVTAQEKISGTAIQISSLSKLDPTIPEHAKYVHEFILDFFERCASNDEEAKFIKSGNGCTDLTLICIRGSDLSDKLSAQHIHRFVLKLLFPTNCINAKFCSKALEFLGMKTPNIFAFDKKSKGAEVALKAVKDIQNMDPDTYELAFMSAFEGADLKQMITNGALYKLNESEWGKALKSFGKIAVLDLLIGNDDRFYRPIFGQDPENVKPFCNSGNVMLDAPIDVTGARFLREVYCIDNGSSILLKPNDQGVFTKANENLLKAFEAAFKFFSIEENHEVFAQKIFDGLQTQFKYPLELQGLSSATKRLFRDEEKGVPYILEGVEEGFKHLKQINRKELINSLKDSYDFDFIDLKCKLYCLKVLDLLNSCLDYLNREVES